MCSTLLLEEESKVSLGIFASLEMRILITISPALNKIIYALLLLPPDLQRDLSAAV